MVGRLKQARWTSPEGQARWKIQIVAEHVELKPQRKKDGDGKGDDTARPKARPRKRQPRYTPRRSADSRRRRGSEQP